MFTTPGCLGNRAPSHANDIVMRKKHMQMQKIVISSSAVHGAVSSTLGRSGRSWQRVCSEDKEVAREGLQVTRDRAESRLHTAQLAFGSCKEPSLSPAEPSQK